MRTTNAADRFSTLPDDQTLPGLSSHSKNTDSAVEVVEDLEPGRERSTAREEQRHPIPEFTCICNHPLVECLQLQVYPDASEGRKEQQSR